MLRLVARGLLMIGGWTPVGTAPELDKALFIAAPHTSNWDGIWGLIYRVAIDLDIHFFAKKDLFWFPLSHILRGLGGIPLDRNVPGAAVRQAVDAFRDNDKFFFGLAPEGTRSLRSHWKTGFYRIAREANVPVVLGFFDYRNRRLGIGPTIELSGDVAADMARIADYYVDIEGRRPENASPVRLPESKAPAS